MHKLQALNFAITQLKNKTKHGCCKHTFSRKKNDVAIEKTESEQHFEIMKTTKHPYHDEKNINYVHLYMRKKSLQKR